MDDSLARRICMMLLDGATCRVSISQTYQSLENFVYMWCVLRRDFWRVLQLERDLLFKKELPKGRLMKFISIIAFEMGNLPVKCDLQILAWFYRNCLFRGANFLCFFTCVENVKMLGLFNFKYLFSCAVKLPHVLRICYFYHLVLRT